MSRALVRWRAKEAPGFSSNDRKVLTNYFSNSFPRGGATAEKILKHAKDSKSPIHKFFEWDDKKAAQKFRVVQANILIKLVVVDVERRTKDVEYQELHFSDHEESKPYLEKRSEKNPENLLDGVLLDALDEAKDWVNRYGKYDDFAEITEAISKVEMTLSKKAKRKK